MDPNSPHNVSAARAAPGQSMATDPEFVQRALHERERRARRSELILHPIEDDPTRRLEGDMTTRQVARAALEVV